MSHIASRDCMFISTRQTDGEHCTRLLYLTFGLHCVIISNSTEMNHMPSSNLSHPHWGLFSVTEHDTVITASRCFRHLFRRHSTTSSIKYYFQPCSGHAEQSDVNFQTKNVSCSHIWTPTSNLIFWNFPTRCFSVRRLVDVTASIFAIFQPITLHIIIGNAPSVFRNAFVERLEMADSSERHQLLKTNMHFGLLIDSCWIIFSVFMKPPAGVTNSTQNG